MDPGLNIYPSMKRILIVEDNKVMQEFYGISLKGSFDITITDTAEEAVELIAENEYDLYIIDLMLRGHLTGDSLLGLGLDPVIVISAYDPGYSFSSLTYLQKPIKSSTLINTIIDLTHDHQSTTHTGS